MRDYFNHITNKTEILNNGKYIHPKTLDISRLHTAYHI